MAIVDDQRYLDVIYAAVELYNATAEDGQKVEKSPEAVLFGHGSKLDSLGFISVIVAVEEMIQEEFEVAVSVADERALTQTPSAFGTLGSLAAHIAGLLKEAADG